MSTHCAPDTSLERLVCDARGGSREAFEALVARFQDMAFATAFAWLRDASRAEDAAQEAFFEAWRNLGQLREDAAFPGFLKRIVRKQCDRVTRRPALAEAGGEASAASGDPEGALVEEAASARLRAAIETLPAHERVVVAVHALAGLSLDEAATWLELPLSTVKKRMHDARRRLRGGLDAMAEATLARLRPSRSEHFSRVIRLFLAIRENDLAAVAALLDAEPALVEAEERWAPEITRAHALPPAAGGTPLVRAAERDLPEMVDLLLDRGADVNAACHCAAAEAPLWAAVANGAARAAERLLARGADPDRPGCAGHTPLHVAAIRGDAALRARLLAHGADPNVRDAHGRTPTDWAEREQLAARPLPRPSQGSAPIETGIRALDLLAPLWRGCLVHANYRPGQGAVVLAGELSRRWVDLAGGRTAVVWAGWARRPGDGSELEHALAELRLEGSVRLVLGDAASPPGLRGIAQSAFDEALRIQGAGAPDALIVVFAQAARAAEIEAALPRAGCDGERSITCVVMERDGSEVPDDGPLRAPWDVRVSFDDALARTQRWPAIDPLRSLSRALRPEQAGAAHCRIAAAARPLLARWRELDPKLRGEPATPETRRARTLQDWLAQPFLVAEAFNGRVGEWPSLAELLAQAQVILDAPDP